MSQIIKNLIGWALDRLKEQSTWKGIFLMLTAVGVTLKPDQIAAITGTGLAIVGLINVLHNEQAAMQKAIDTDKSNSAPPFVPPPK